MTTQYVITKEDELSNRNSISRMVGFKGSAPTGTTYIDWQVPIEMWTTGGIFVFNDAHFGDYIELYVVSIVGGVTTVVGQLAETCYVQQGDSILYFNSPYVSYVPAGVYIRIKYVNTIALSSVGVALNIKRHIPIDA